MYRFTALGLALSASLFGLAPAVSGAPSSHAVREAARAEPNAARPLKGRRYVVAAIGDSLTDPRSGGGFYLRELSRRCPESRFDAYGVGGQQTQQMRWRLEQDLFGIGLPAWHKPKPRYTHVVILGGVNDLSAWGVRYAQIGATTSNLSAMYRKARARDLEVIALTVPPWTGLRGTTDARAQATRKLNSWILSQAEQGQISQAVDIHPLLSCGNEDQLCPRYRRFPRDLVHWGRAAHVVVADALTRQAFADCR